jgi:hypothetical protein
VKRLGLIDAIRSKLVDEVGLSIVDTDGNVKGTIPVNKTGQGAQALTSRIRDHARRPNPHIP